MRAKPRVEASNQMNFFISINENKIIILVYYEGFYKCAYLYADSDHWPVNVLLKAKITPKNVIQI